MSQIDRIIVGLKAEGFDVEVEGVIESHKGVAVLLVVRVPNTNRADSIVLFEPHFMRPLGATPLLPS